MSGQEVHTVAVSAERSYSVVIGAGLLAELAEMLTGSDRVAIIHQPTLRVSAEAIQADLSDSGLEVILIEVPDAEDAKTAEVAAYCWNALGSSGFTRSDAIVGLGGGAVTDLAGFIAATWLRGVRCILVPTTVLAMVDAAVGGKTGINTAAGKNLVGCFSSPAGVICDTSTLAALPRNELLAGMAEVIKVGLTSDNSILADIRADVDLATDPERPLLADLIRRAVQVKADVVGADFLETSATFGDGKIGREVLNYGHTFGHALERVENYRWRHGAAVSVGLMYVAELAHLGGRLDAAGLETHREIIDLLGLPRTYRGDRWEQLYPAMALDKKARGNTLRFVVLDGLQQPVIWTGPDPALLHAAYSAISE